MRSTATNCSTRRVGTTVASWRTDCDRIWRCTQWQLHVNRRALTRPDGQNQPSESTSAGWKLGRRHVPCTSLAGFYLISPGPGRKSRSEAAPKLTKTGGKIPDLCAEGDISGAFCRHCRRVCLFRLVRRTTQSIGANATYVDCQFGGRLPSCLLAPIDLRLAVRRPLYRCRQHCGACCLLHYPDVPAEPSLIWCRRQSSTSPAHSFRS